MTLNMYLFSLYRSYHIISQVFLNWRKGYCYHYKIVLIMVTRVGDGDPSFPVHPLHVIASSW